MGKVLADYSLSTVYVIKFSVIDMSKMSPQPFLKSSEIVQKQIFVCHFFLNYGAICIIFKHHSIQKEVNTRPFQSIYSGAFKHFQNHVLCFEEFYQSLLFVLFFMTIWLITKQATKKL